MINLLARSQLRYLSQHRIQTLLAVMGIALGVAIVNAVDISNYSARQNLRDNLQQLDDAANYRIIAASRYFDEQHYATLRYQLLSAFPALSLTPVISGRIRSSVGDQAQWQILGIDPLTSRHWLPETATAHALQPGTLLSEHNAVLISSALAEKSRLQIGDLLSPGLPDYHQRLLVAGIFPGDNPAWLIADIGLAQQLLAKPAQLSYISVSLDEQPRLLTAIQQALPAGLSLQKNQLLLAGQLSLIQALEFNLSALGVLAILVGALLIYNSVRFSLLQRSPLFARLRVQGVSQRQLQRLMLSEALLLATTGLLIGWLLGLALSQQLVPLSSRMISELYSSSLPAVTSLHWSIYTKTALIAVLMTLGSYLYCLQQQGFAPLSHALLRIQQEQRSRGASYRPLLVSLILAASAALLMRQQQSLTVSYMLAVALFASALLWLPTFFRLLYPPLIAVSQRWFGITGLIALRDCQREQSRVMLAVLTLSIAVSASSGIAIMVDSFRHSVTQWLDTTLSADLYIRPSHAEAIAPRLLQLLATEPAIEQLYGSQFNQQFVDNKWLTMNILPAAAIARGDTISWLHTEQAQAVSSFRQGQLLISEPLARKKQLHRGDTLQLMTARGITPFIIGGVFYDYGAEHGRIMIERQHYDRYWTEQHLDSIAVYLHDPGNKTAIIKQLTDRYAAAFAIHLVDSAAIKQLVLTVFERTFIITQMIQWLVLGIAVIAIIATLMLYQLQRRQQLLTLRALGLTVGELRGLFFIQAGFIGGMAGLLSVPLGLLMAWLLVRLINPAAFGWSLQFHIDPTISLTGLLLALIASLLAALYPCLHFSPATSLTELNRD